MESYWVSLNGIVTFFKYNGTNIEKFIDKRYDLTKCQWGKLVYICDLRDQVFEDDFFDEEPNWCQYKN
jgi:hypothetical protein